MFRRKIGTGVGAQLNRKHAGVASCVTSSSSKGRLYARSTNHMVGLEPMLPPAAGVM